MNYAIDRPAMLRVGGLLAGKRTDQILPPSMRGFRDAKLYPIKGADPAKAKSLAGGSSADVTILHTTSASSVARGQILQFNLKQMGMNPKLKPQPFGVAIKTAGDKHGDFDAFLIGWWPTIRIRSTSSTCSWTATTSRSQTTRTTPTSTSPSTTRR